MKPWLGPLAWDRVAKELCAHRVDGFGAVLTEDVLRFATARALAHAGCAPTSLAVERPHPAIRGSRVDLVVGEPARAIIELKYPREPSEKNAAWTMTLGEVLKDFYRLAVYPGPVDRLFVLAATSRLKTYLRSSADRYGMDVDRDRVELGPAAAAALPRTAASIIGAELAAHHLTANRIFSLAVDDNLHLGIYLVDPIANPNDPMVGLAADGTSLSGLLGHVPVSSERRDERKGSWTWGEERRSIWDLLAEGIAQLDEPFRRSQIIGWFRWHHPEVNEASLGAHIQAATSNSGHPTGQFSSRQPLLTRIDHGVYRRFRSAD